MAGTKLLQLAQDLDWLGAELGHCSPNLTARNRIPAAMAGDVVTEKQHDLLATAEKIQRELINSVRFDPTRLVGVGASAEDTINSVADLLSAIEEIKTAVHSGAEELPSKIKSVTKMVRTYVDTVPTAA